MKSALRTELKKALYNKMLWIAIGIGLLFCCGDILENIPQIQDYTQMILSWSVSAQDRKVGTGHMGFSLFYLWMGLCPNTYSGYLFFTIWPVLTAMAYGWSYNEERRSGVYNQIAARSSVVAYYVSKYIAVFISGGLAIGIPMLVNLLGNALVCPYEPISPIAGPVSNQYFLSELFYTCPWAYGLAWCGTTFLLGGTAACLCFTVGAKLRYSVIVILTPYAIYVALDALLASFGIAFMNEVNLILSPLRMIYATPGFGNPEWFLFTALLVLIAGSFTIGYWQVTRHELV